jgi:hypothetical protein
MKDQILKIAKVKSEKEFYKKYPSEEAFMKAHGKAFKKAAMGSKMVNDQLHQLTDFGNPPIAQIGGKYNKYLQGTNQPGLNPDGSIKQVGDAFNNASMAQYSGQQTASQMSAQYAPPSSDKLMGINDINSGAAKAGGGVAGAAMAGLNALPAIIGGIEAIGQQKKAIKKADQSAQLSGLASQAANTREKVERKYVRPEDSLVQPGQLGNPYGSGTNYLAAQNGTMIGGNPTEIQNTYAPTGDLYQDLGFEPLEETYKQYKKGGRMPKAELGEYFQDSGQAQIGGAAGEAIGNMLGGPLGGMAGKLIGQVGGNLLGGAKDARKLKKYQDEAAMNSQQAAWQNQLQSGQFSKSMEHGGYMNPEYNPQVIAKFGDYDVKDLLKPPYDADMLRSGGHLAQVGYTAPSAEAMFTGRPNMPQAEYGTQMAMGGELEVGDGGRLETLSYNPNLPGGEIGMFRGASHDNGGIKTKYGENEVEVEGGEPAVKLQDGGSSENLVVFGNIKINKEIADLMGDPKAKGKKFKTYIADIAKNDAKQLKRINKGLELIENSNENSAFDHLSLNTGKAILQGATAWQKINAEKIKEAGIVQDAIHQTASQLGVKSDKLAEGKLEQETDPSMIAKFGTNMDIAQRGIKAPLFGRMLGVQDRPAYYNEVLQNQLMNAGMPNKTPEVTPFTKANMLAQGFKDSTNKPASSKPAAGKSSSAKGKGKSQVYVPPTAVNLTDNRQGNYEWTNPQSLSNPQPASSISSIEYDQSGGDLPNSPIEKLFSSDQIDTGKEKFDWKGLGQMALSNLAPFLRPSNANDDLPPDQLYPEYFALATNQLEPVQAQTYQPMLDTPYDISLNDQINAIDSQARAAIRAGGNNPAAQSMIMAQAIEAKNKVLGEQTRINQSNKMQVYDKNRATLNDAQLKNLAIYDQQYVRQAQAKSNTKQQSLAALSSIAAKTAQQRASNRKLAIMENMYGFRFSPSGRAINMNAPAQFDLSGSGSRRGGLSDAGLPANKRFTIDSVTGEPVGIRTLTKDEMAGNRPSMSEIDNYLDNQKKGGKTPKTKARNSSIVRSLKSL